MRRRLVRAGRRAVAASAWASSLGGAEPAAEDVLLSRGAHRSEVWVSVVGDARLGEWTSVCVAWVVLGGRAFSAPGGDACGRDPWCWTTSACACARRSRSLAEGLAAAMWARRRAGPTRRQSSLVATVSDSLRPTLGRADRRVEGDEREGLGPVHSRGRCATS